MKTIEECLDEAVKRKSEFSSDFKELMLKYKTGDYVRVFVESVIEEAMNIFAEQRETEIAVFLIDKGYVKASIDLLSFTPNVAEKS